MKTLASSIIEASSLMTIVNDDARIVNKLDASIIDDARVFIYDCHMFIVQTTDHMIQATEELTWLTMMVTFTFSFSAKFLWRHHAT